MQPLKSALDKKSAYDLFKKESQSLWSKSWKNTGIGFMLVKKDFFLRILPAFNHKF